MLLITALAIAAAIAPTAQVNLYPKSSAVLSVNAESYDRIIAQSNYTSIVEFYSPHCIHCRNLQPVYEKVALSLAGLAKVAAVNCEEESNRDLCNQFGIQGFPTLKIVKPGKTPGKPIVSEYRESRTAKAIVETVVDKISNLVEKPKEDQLDKWIQDAGENPVAILFTNKPRISALFKVLAIEFKGSIKFAHVLISNGSKGIEKLYEIEKIPTLMLIRNGKNSERLRHDGEMKKESLVKFLSQAAAPNPDPAPIIAKQGSSHPSFRKDTAQKPIKFTESALPLDILEKKEELVTQCMGLKTSTCILAFQPESSDDASPVIDALTQLVHKFKQQKRSTVSSFVLPRTNPKYKDLKMKLSLKEHSALIAINGKRKWWDKLPEVDFSNPKGIQVVIENWVTTIQLGEGEKRKLPSGLIHEEPDKSETDNADQISSSDREKKTGDGDAHDEL